MQRSVTSMVMARELWQTFAFVYLRLDIGSVSSAVVLGITFIWRGHESKYFGFGFVEAKGFRKVCRKSTQSDS